MSKAKTNDESEQDQQGADEQASVATKRKAKASADEIVVEYFHLGKMFKRVFTEEDHGEEFAKKSQDFMDSHAETHPGLGKHQQAKIVDESSLLTESEDQQARSLKIAEKTKKKGALPAAEL